MNFMHMKYTVIFWVLLYLIFTLGCKTRSIINNKSNDLCCKDEVINSSVYLSSRIPDCDKAIRYMDRVVIPTYIVIGHVAGLPKVVYGSFEIKNEKISTYKSNKHLLYLNDQCFIGMPSRLIYDTFCPDSMVVSLLKAGFINNKMNKVLPIKLDLGGVVGLTFEIENSVIISSKFYKFTSSSE